MSEDYYEQLRKDPLYVSRADRAKANKAPSKSSSMGTMAEVRYPNAANREDLMSGIMDQDKDLFRAPSQISFTSQSPLMALISSWNPYNLV